MSGHTVITSFGALQRGGPALGQLGQQLGQTGVSPILTAAAAAAGTGLINAVTGQIFDRGSDITVDPLTGVCGSDCPPGFHFDAKRGCCVKTRRRRKRMLTCGDKSDISFLTATLGKGDMAKAAIGALLSRSC